jgi:crossover junction endodeoxyribonuclease RusA
VLTSLQLNLPWPPPALSSNKRQHWSRLAKAKKAYRAACYVETLRQVHGKPVLPNTLRLALEFAPPDRRRRDRDNLVAAMKAGLDGMADALGIDDSRFETLEARVLTTLTPARGAAHVVVTITDGWRPPIVERGPDGMPARMFL